MIKMNARIDEEMTWKVTSVNANYLVFHIHITTIVLLYFTLPSSGTKAGLVKEAFIARASGVMRVAGTIQSSIGSSSTVRASRITSATCMRECCSM